MLTLEQNRAAQARWRANHLEEARAKNRAWKRANPDKCSAYSRRHVVRKQASEFEVFTNIEIYERDGWVCGICHEPIDPELAWPDPMSASPDHIIPLAKQGAHTRANVQASHLVCNQRKGDK